MANRLKTFVRKVILGKTAGLISLEDPFDVMPRLLRNHEITGILDAGASNGRISRRFLRRFRRAHVFAFEPNGLYTPTLQRYAKVEPRFHPYGLALSDATGQACLNLTASPGSTSLLIPGARMRESFPEPVSVADHQQVNVTTIDDWACSNGNPSLQIMKFDIQGAELKALRGAGRALHESTLLIYTEVWFNPGYEGGAIYSEIDLFLRSYGFVLHDLYKPHYDCHAAIAWGDAIFIHAERVKP